MRIAIAMISVILAAGCEQLNKPRPGSDFNGDGRVDFRDLDHQPPLTPQERIDDTRDPQQRFEDHMARQVPDADRRIRKGEIPGY